MPKISPSSITELLAMPTLESQDGSEFDQILSQVIKREKLPDHRDRAVNFEPNTPNEEPLA